MVPVNAAFILRKQDFVFMDKQTLTENILAKNHRIVYVGKNL